MGDIVIPDDLVGVYMVHVVSGDVAQIMRRKDDDSGWWLFEGGGLCDEVIADGAWVPLAVVLLHWRTTGPEHCGRRPGDG